jgi:mannose-6-phosphate isomerase-like protein (cupin superfamily)
MGQVDFGFELRLVPLYAGRLAMVEHPMAPGVLAAPVHTHTREDECSYVLAGRIEALIGDGEVQAGPGDIVWKPRDVPHTFWNPGPERALVVEVITPGGLEGYFEERGHARGRTRGSAAGGRARGSVWPHPGHGLHTGVAGARSQASRAARPN